MKPPKPSKPAVLRRSPSPDGAPVPVVLQLSHRLRAGLFHAWLEERDQRGTHLLVLTRMVARNIICLFAQQIEIEIGRSFDNRLIHTGRPYHNRALGIVF